MKSLYSLLFLLSLILTSLTGYSQLIAKKQLFTENSKAEMDFRGITMDKILFYTSGEVYIKRQIDKIDTANATTKGKVVFENGKAYEYVQITSSATGLCDTSNNEMFQIRFRKDPTTFLVFKKQKHKRDPEAKYYLVIPANNKLLYGGYKWEVILGKNVHLYWKPKEKGKNKKSKEKVKGLKMDGTEKKSLKAILKGNK